MKLGTSLGYSGARIDAMVDHAKLAESLGFDSIWTAEAYGSDAITPLAWIGSHTSRIRLGTAIMQMPARTPSMTAMTAATLDGLSGGRFICGIGLSGPQVVEGWHGVEYGKPLVRTREYVQILRDVWKREKPLQHSGTHYTVPVAGGTGLGKPLKSILHPRADIPIVIAAIGPKNVALAAEIADGFIPAFFSPQRIDVFRPWLREGFAKRSGDLRPVSEFEIVASARVIITKDVKTGLQQVKPGIGFYIGGMGARTMNFYNNLAQRYGFEKEAKQIQDLFLEGNRDEAMAAVPDQLADEVSLVGPIERIKERLEVWRDAGVTTLNVGGDATTMRAMAEIVG